MEDKQNTLNKVLYLSIGIILLFLALLFSIIAFIQRKDTIYFYDINKSSQKVIEKIILETPTVKKRRIKFEVLDSSVPLSSLIESKKLHKASLIFANNNYDVLDVVNNPTDFYKKMNVQNLSVEFLDGMPQSIVEHTKNMTLNSTSEGDFVKFLPILYDFYQVDVHFPLFQKSNVKNINIWEDLVNSAANSTKNCSSPVLININNQIEYINTLGMIAEALSSPTEYEVMTKNLYAAYKNGSEALQTELENLLTSDSALKKAVDAVNYLISKKFISSTAITFSDDDIQFYVDNQLSLFYFTKLSKHRQIERTIINNYKSIYCPGATTTSTRKFSAPEIGVFCVKEKKYTKDVLLNLVRTRQTELCTESGLAPVQKNCIVPDLQADDVRYWLAASNGPTLPLAAALPTTEAKEIFVKACKETN